MALLRCARNTVVHAGAGGRIPFIAGVAREVPESFVSDCLAAGAIAEVADTKKATTRKNSEIDAAKG